MSRTVGASPSSSPLTGASNGSTTRVSRRAPITRWPRNILPDAHRLFSPSASSAGSTAPRLSTTRRQMTPAEQLKAGVRPETIRISVGIEHSDDIVEDLDQALGAAATAVR